MEGLVEKKPINPVGWQDAFGFAQGTLVSGAQDIMMISGQVPVDAEGTPQHAGDLASQITLAFDNLEAVLAKAGWSLADIVDIRIYTLDMDNFLEASEPMWVRLAEAGCTPSSSLLGVARLFHPDVLVEIEAVAMK